MTRFYLSLLASLSFMPAVSHAVENRAGNTPDILHVGKADDRLPVTINADSMTYDTSTGIVTAEGDVEIIRGADIVITDTAYYDRTASIVTAEGNVNWLRGSDGTVIHADKASINHVTKQGDISNIKAEFVDNSAVYATSATRKDGKIIAKNASYSPCPLCINGIRLTPPWRITAKEAAIDEAKENVTYKHVSFRVKDTPIMYIPYFSHPTPGAKRKSGYLTPSYRNDSVFGSVVDVPYYYNIKPNMDIITTSTYSSEEGPSISGTYRHLLENGAYTFTASGAYPRRVTDTGARTSGREFRGHIEGEGNIDISRNWTTGYTLQRATDDTYLRRYNINNQDMLTSTGYARFLTRNSWFEAQAITFQSLEATDDPAETPLILPEIRYAWNGDEGTVIPHTSLSLEGGALMLLRDIGSSTSRLNAAIRSHTPKRAGGHLFALDTSLRADAYLVDVSPREGEDTKEEVLRIVPEVSLSWRYPLIRREEGRSFLLEPTARLTSSPNGGNPEEITNEDSQDVEFTASNLFSRNRFSGFDRIETGTRFAYGVKAGVTDQTLGEAHVTVGHNSRLRENTDFDALSGLRDQQSDYVVRASYRKQPVARPINFRLDTEARFDSDDFALNSQVIYAAADVNDVTVSAEYLSTDDLYEAQGAVIDSREALLARIKTPVPRTEHWNISARGHRDLGNSEWVSAGGELEYSGDCYGVVMSLNREFTRDRDIEPATTFGIKVTLKNFTP